jgi:hypothetical protein
MRLKIFRMALLPLMALGFCSFSAFAQRATSAPVVREIDSPAAPASAEPNLFAASDGRVFLSWVESTGEHHHALRFSVRKGERWSEARTIAEGDNWFVNWADFPSLVALSDGSLVAHWLVKNGANAHAFNIHVARSTDGGKMWSQPLVPHRDGTPTEHGFVSLLPLGQGRVGAVWLDGRRFETKSGEHSLSNEMTLRYATIDRAGQLTDEAMIDGRVCDCCQTAAAMTAQGMIVAYRDRSENEIRDISVMRFANGQWTAPRPVNADGWELAGCPVNGPAIAAHGHRVAVAWFTAAKDTPRVNVSFSSDAGANFGPAVQVDTGQSVGRVGVLMLADGAALVCWLERTAQGGEIKARRVQADGTRDEAITIAQASATRSSGLPRMARTGNEIVFAWTDASTPSRVRTSVMKATMRRSK